MTDNDCAAGLAMRAPYHNWPRPSFGGAPLAFARRPVQKRGMNRLAACSLLALLGVLAASVTRATESVDPQAAAQYRRGTELAEQGDHAGAIRAYEEALK